MMHFLDVSYGRGNIYYEIHMVLKKSDKFKIRSVTNRFSYFKTTVMATITITTARQKLFWRNPIIQRTCKFWVANYDFEVKVLESCRRIDLKFVPVIVMYFNKLI
jgi:hypothetical protein